MDSRDWIDGLFREHADGLFRYLRSFRLPEDDTYDLVQNVFLKLLDVKPGSLRQPRAWLFTVGRNLALNALSTRSRFTQDRGRQDGPDPDLSDLSPGPLDQLVRDEENQRLWTLFKSLGPEEQELFRLHLEHGLSYGEIGKIVGRSSGAVKIAVHRARAGLKQKKQGLFQADEAESSIGERSLAGNRLPIPQGQGGK